MSNGMVHCLRNFVFALLVFVPCGTISGQPIRTVTIDSLKVRSGNQDTPIYLGPVSGLNGYSLVSFNGVRTLAAAGATGILGPSVTTFTDSSMFYVLACNTTVLPAGVCNHKWRIANVGKMDLSKTSFALAVDTVFLSNSFGAGASGNAVVVGGSGNTTLRAGTGSGSHLTVQVGAANTTTVRHRLGAINGDGMLMVPDGRSNEPGVAFLGDSTIGISRSASFRSILFLLGGTQVARLDSQTTGGNGVGFKLVNGTAANPSFAFINGVSTGVYLGDNGTSDTLGLASRGVAFAKGISDTLLINSKAKAPALTAASGTPNSVCMNATTKQLLENAATSCVVSSRRFKKNIAPLSDVTAQRIVQRLRPTTFTYKDGSREAIGLIAEDAAVADGRLVSRDSDGKVHSVNYEQVTILLLAVVQRQQRQIDSLLATARKP